MSKRAVTFILISVPFILLAPVYLTGKAVYWGTPALQFVPWWAQAWRTLLNGELPLWNPLLGMGAPLLANYQTALLYPPTWLYFLLFLIGGVPLMAWGIAPVIALHLSWAGFGMARLARELGWRPLAQLVAGLAFGMSGYLVSRGNFLSIIAAAAWTPWVLWAVYRVVVKQKRRAILQLALIAAMQLLTGHAQTTWYTFVLAGFWALYWAAQQQDWKALVRAALGMSWAGGIAAVQLLPTAEYLLNSSRAGAYDLEGALTYSYWPWRLLTFIAPNLFGNPAHGDYWGYAAFWEDAAYFGVLGLLLVFYSLINRGKSGGEKRFARLLIMVIAISFLLSFGEHSLLFLWLYEHIPSFDLFQAPSRWLLWAQVAFALLAGLGVQLWRRPQGRALYWSRLGTAGMFAVSLAALLNRFIPLPPDPQLALRLGTFIPAFTFAGVWGLGAGILHLTAPVDDKPAVRWQAAVSIWLALDLLVAGWGLIPGVDLDFYRGNTEIIPGRIYMLPDAEDELKFKEFLLFSDYHAIENWSSMRTAQLPNLTLLDGQPSSNNFDPIRLASYTNWIASNDPKKWQQSGISMVIDAQGFEQIQPFTRAYWADRSTEEISFTDDTANRVELRTSRKDTGELLLADMAAPGWQVYVDGEVVGWNSTKLGFRQVDVPAGSHVITFVYRPLSVYIGFIISLMAWLLWAVIWRKQLE